jgi:hypothetical protein
MVFLEAQPDEMEVNEEFTAGTTPRSQSQLDDVATDKSASEDGISYSDVEEADYAKTLRDLFQAMHDFETRRTNPESERTRLLEKLIHKIQPELSEAEKVDRVSALKEKFKNFELADLRALVGEEAEVGKSSVMSRDSLGKAERALLDQLDEESIAELQDEVTAEVKEKLSELGLPTEGIANILAKEYSPCMVFCLHELKLN